MEQERPVKSSVLTRSRYDEIMGLLSRKEEISVEELRTEFLRIMCYDPTKKQYNAEKGKQMMASRRRRAAELGISVYEYKTGRWKNEKERLAEAPI